MKFRFLLLLTALLLGARSTAADDPIAELRERIESLERQNAELRQSLSGPPTSTFHQPTPLVPPAPGPDGANGAGGANGFHAPEGPYPPHNGTYLPPICEDCPPSYGNAGNYWGDLDLRASWNHGLELYTPDRAFRVHVGGRTQFDAGWFAADRNVQRNINIPYGNGVDFRRARLRVDGTMYETMEWAVEYDFVNSARVGNVTNDGYTDFDVTALTDMWWTFTKLPVVGNLRIGNQKEAIGFEHLVSSRWQPFMERSFNQDAFYGGLFNGFTPGVSIFDNYADERGMWQIGLYKPTDNVFAFNTNSADYAATGRVTYLPWYENEGRELLHLGFSTRASSTVDGRTRFRTRDAIRSGVSATWPVPADTGTIVADHQQFLNGELVAVEGPWTLQSEYLVSFVQDARPVGGANAGELMYHGGYIQLMYFLTGESDYYNPQTAVFERVTPFHNAARSSSGVLRGIGAWQVGVRYNYLDLNDRQVDGGELHNLSCTLNWFLNPNMKIQFDYSATDRDAPLLGNAGDGWIHAWGMRVAHDF